MWPWAISSRKKSPLAQKVVSGKMRRDARAKIGLGIFPILFPGAVPLYLLRALVTPAGQLTFPMGSGWLMLGSSWRLVLSC